jgi:hypothetical protein
MAVGPAQRGMHIVPGLCMLHKSGKEMVQYQTFVFGKEKRSVSRMEMLPYGMICLGQSIRIPNCSIHIWACRIETRQHLS